MFDIGFWELAVIGIVALLVIGPNRLPEVARTAGIYIGKVRRFVSSVQRDINNEISKTEELQRLLEEQKKLVERHEIIEELSQTIPITGKSTAAKPADSAIAAPAIADESPAQDSKTDGK